MKYQFLFLFFNYISMGNEFFFWQVLPKIVYHFNKILTMPNININ